MLCPRPRDIAIDWDFSRSPGIAPSFGRKPISVFRLSDHKHFHYLKEFCCQRRGKVRIGRLFLRNIAPY